MLCNLTPFKCDNKHQLYSKYQKGYNFYIKSDTQLKLKSRSIEGEGYISYLEFA